MKIKSIIILVMKKAEGHEFEGSLLFEDEDREIGLYDSEYESE